MFLHIKVNITIVAISLSTILRHSDKRCHFVGYVGKCTSQIFEHQSSLWTKDTFVKLLVNSVVFLYVNRPDWQLVLPLMPTVLAFM